jgi:hypothetical protein
MVNATVECICKECGRSFIAKDSRVKYCNYGCRQQHGKTNKSVREVECTCLGCGKKFYVSKSRYSSTSVKYCSRDCRIKYGKAGRPPCKVERKCLCCGRKFMTHRSQINAGGGKYCSRRCAAKGSRAFKTQVKKVKCKCVACGKTYHIHQSDVKNWWFRQWCSRECYFVSYPERAHKFTCLRCGKEFLSDSKTAKYCSKACKYDGKIVNRLLKACRHCGKHFSTHNKNQKYCSKECKQKAEPVFPNVTCICGYCGKTFMCSQTREGIGKPTRKFCSYKCKGMATRGENSPAYKNGMSYQGYCEVFNDETRTNARHAFKYHCVLCGKPEGKRKLHVHHVFYDKSNGCGAADMRMNLVPLCSSCHMSTNHYRGMYAQFFGSILEATYLGKHCHYDPAWLKIPHRRYKVAEHTYLGKAFKYKTEYY